MSFGTNRVAFVHWFAVLIAANLGCSGGTGRSFDTPEACFEGAKEAVAHKDPLSFLDCVTDESQQVLAGSMVSMGGMMKMVSSMAALGGPQAAELAQQRFAEMDAVLEQHGLTEDKLKDAIKAAQGPPNSDAIKAAGDLVSDQRMFIAQMIGAMEKVGDGGPSFAQKFAEEFVGELKDVKIDGDRATATLAKPDGEQPIEFRKTPVGWKLHVNINDFQHAGGTAPAEAQSTDAPN